MLSRIPDIVRMPTYRGLISDMAKDPDNDSIRMIAADFVEDSGCDEWAEFIRFQIAHPEKKQRCGARAILWPPCSHKSPCQHCHILACHGVPCEVLHNGRYWIRRGFLEAVGMNANDYQAFHQDIIAASPIKYIYIDGKKPYRSINRPIFYAWVASSDNSSLRGDNFFIPCDLFGRLGGIDDNLADPKVKRYSDRKDAIDDLARSIVIWRREFLEISGYLI